jgi:TDG/mug DNA glycosylase family protein
MGRRGLPDYIRSGLDILLVGINPGLRSAELGHHFAGVNNRFWSLLHDAAITPHRLSYEEDCHLTDYGVGLTNIAARPTRTSSELTPADYDRGRAALARKIRRYQPKVVAFVGVTVYREFWRGKGKLPPRLQCGLQEDTFEGAELFVVPNPSGRNAHYTYDEMLKYWQELAGFVRSGSRR